MKKTLVIVVHPTLSTSTINKAWSEAAYGHATLHFLYDAYPNGASFDIAAEQALIEAHDRIVFQFPLYWYAAPYLLKKWLDEVITYGWAYGEGGDKMEGKNKSFLRGEYNVIPWLIICRFLTGLQLLFGLNILGFMLCTTLTIRQQKKICQPIVVSTLGF